MKVFGQLFIGWIVTTLVVTLIVFTALSSLISLASLLVWEWLFTIELAKQLLLLSSLIAAVTAIFMLWHDTNGYLDTWDD